MALINETHSYHLGSFFCLRLLHPFFLSLPRQPTFIIIIYSIVGDFLVSNAISLNETYGFPFVHSALVSASALVFYLSLTYAALGDERILGSTNLSLILPQPLQHLLIWLASLPRTLTYRDAAEALRLPFLSVSAAAYTLLLARSRVTVVDVLGLGMFVAGSALALRPTVVSPARSE